MTCKELIQLVSDYIDGNLSPEEAERFDMHLAECNGCTAYVEQFRETVRLAGTLREEDVSPAARDTLIEAFAEWRRARA